jgi:hypothetical protein
LAVIEAGVLVGGLPIVKVQYYDDAKAGSLLTAGLLEAIQQFASDIFNDETESFKMKRYNIYLLREPFEKNKPITAYCICERGDRETTIKDLLDIMIKRFLERFDSIEHSSLEKYRTFETIIDNAIGDLKFRPDERLKKVFL